MRSQEVVGGERWWDALGGCCKRLKAEPSCEDRIPVQITKLKETSIQLRRARHSHWFSLLEAANQMRGFVTSSVKPETPFVLRLSLSKRRRKKKGKRKDAVGGYPL